MKISYNWLKDYLNIDLSPDELSVILTDIGLEVEGLEHTQAVAGGLAGLVIGEVKTAEKHPNADRLKVTTVDVGTEELLHIVCGAPNVAAGQKVVVATVGTMLYPTAGEPFKIKKGKIRGEVSMGMICAEDEIGLGVEHDGIIVLPDSVQIGQPAKTAFDLNEDYVFEIGLTPNRSDAFCHIGSAKDVLAFLKVHHNFTGKVTMPSVANFKVDNHDLTIPVEVENYEACPRYTGVSIKGVTIKESPDWMKERLLAVGVRPINNIVDITNFVLHEIGQPLHAFDADKIAGGKIIVKNLPENAPFLSLDEVERKLFAEDLMICDANSKGMCIAGVFGGLDSGVTDSTTNIFLESACFHPIKTRVSATRHNLRTDAAMRFEKGVDPNVSVYALKRAAMLIKELGGGEIASEIVDIYPQKVAKKEVLVRYKKVNTLLGTKLSGEEIKNIITALEMDIVAEDENSITAAVPTNKVEVTREVDMIEEIVRIYGLNNIPFPEQMRSSLSYRPSPDPQAIRKRTSDFLVAKGLNEMMGTSITNSSYYEGETDVVKILKSMNANMDVMRKRMVYSGLEAVKHNQNHYQTNVTLFEFGKTYNTYQKDDINQYNEQEHLTLFLSGNKNNESWQGAQQPYTFFDLKALVQQLFEKLGLMNVMRSRDYKGEELSYGMELMSRKKTVVSFGALNHKLLKQMGIKQAVLYADFNWSYILELMKYQKVNFAEIARFPSVRRDLALLLNKEVNFGDVAAIAIKTDKKLLKTVNLFDIYDDESKIGKGKKSYAVSFIFQNYEKTLTDKEIDKIMQKLIHNYEKQLGATLR